MNLIQRILIQGCIPLLFMVTGCQNHFSKLGDSVSNSLPQSFLPTSDTTNSAQVKWRDFFQDPNLVLLIDSALKNNFDLLMAFQKIQVARNDLKLSKAAMLPVGGASLAYQQRKFGYYTMDDAGNRTTEITPGKMVPTHLPDFFTGFQTNWEADIWGKLRTKQKAALSRYLSSVEGSNLVVTNLIAEIADTYYDLLAYDAELEIVRQTTQIQQDALEVVKVQKEAGASNELAVKQFESQVLHSQSLEYDLLQSIKETENRLNFLMGRMPQPILRNRDGFVPRVPNSVKAGIPSQLLRNRPDIREAEFELQASKFDLMAARAAFYPDFTISASVGFQSFNPAYLINTPQSIAYNLLGGLTAPLINRSAIKAQFSNAKSNQLNALYNYQQAILTGFVEVSNQLSAIENLEQIYTRKEKETSSLTMAVNISNDLFKSGRANYVEVLLAQNQSLQARLDLISTRKRQYQATVHMYKALGGGWR